MLACAGAIAMNKSPPVHRAKSESPLLIDPVGVSTGILERVDALVLSGGPDVDPACYGQAPHEKTYGVNRAIDDFEPIYLGIVVETFSRTGLAGKRIDVNDNLFEIGASSLKLIEIHENIDREFPGLIDLTELFDHPTIAELAKHLEQKIATGSP